MNTLKTAVWNRLHSGGMVAALVPSSSEMRKAWIGIYPVDSDRIGDIYSLRSETIRDLGQIESPWIYRVTTFEVNTEWIDNDWDISEDELENRKWHTARSDEDLVELLTKLGADLGGIDAPWKCDYPL